MGCGRQVNLGLLVAEKPSQLLLTTLFYQQDGGSRHAKERHDAQSQRQIGVLIAGGHDVGTLGHNLGFCRGGLLGSLGGQWPLGSAGTGGVGG